MSSALACRARREEYSSGVISSRDMCMHLGRLWHAGKESMPGCIPRPQLHLRKGQEPDGQLDSRLGKRKAAFR